MKWMEDLAIIGIFTVRVLLDSFFFGLYLNTVGLSVISVTTAFGHRFFFWIPRVKVCS